MRSGRGASVLTIGGTGFIGRNLAARLARADARVFVTSRRPVESAPLPLQASCLTADISETDKILDLIDRHDIGTVVHMACNMLPASRLADLLAERASIVDPTIALARELAARDVRLVYLSSGGTVYGVSDGRSSSEADRCLPISLYGQNKLEVEGYLQFFGRTEGLKYVIVRPSNPFGPGQSTARPQGLIATILNQVRQGQPLQVWGDGSAVRDYIYIDDLVESLYCVIDSDLNGLAINIGSGVGHSLLQVVETVEGVIGKAVPVQFHDGRASDVPHMVLDISLLSGLGMSFSRPIASAIATYAASLEEPL